MYFNDPKIPSEKLAKKVKAMPDELQLQNENGEDIEDGLVILTISNKWMLAYYQLKWKQSLEVVVRRILQQYLRKWEKENAELRS